MTAPNPLRDALAWRQQPGETHYSFIQRRSADYAAWQREQDAISKSLAEHRSGDALSVDLAAGVGCYDANGLPKGSGWF